MSTKRYAGFAILLTMLLLAPLWGWFVGDVLPTGVPSFVAIYMLLVPWMAGMALSWWLIR